MTAFKPRRVSRSRVVAPIVALLPLMLLLTVGCSDSAKDDIEEALTGQDKITKAIDAATLAELSTVGREVSSWYVMNDGDPKLTVSGGSYYICAASAGNCASEGTLIGPATAGAQVMLARSGESNWCISLTVGEAQAHVNSGGTAMGSC
jgi:hypothetical protein